MEKLKPRILSDSVELPPWLQRQGYDIWQRHNLWLLFNALAMNAQSLTLIALWNGRPPDGPGGARIWSSTSRRAATRSCVSRRSG